MENTSLLGRIRRSEAASGLALISPTAVYAILLLAAPLATVLIYSVMTDGPIVGVDWTFNLGNYATVWTEPIYRAIMLRSLVVAVAVTAATVILAYPVAYFISFSAAPSKKSLWLFLITIPFWTSYVIRVFIWKGIILGYNGVINQFLQGIGLTSEPLQIFSYNVGAIVLTLAHAYAPFAILPIFVSLEKIDRSLLEAGQDLGENRFVTFLRVTLPLSMPGVIAAVMIVFIPTVGDYVTPTLIGGGKIPMIANLIQNEMLKQHQMAMGSAIAVSAMLIVCLCAGLFLLATRRYLGVGK